MQASRKILAVIGAGPKGIAVAVKAKVLAEFGFPVDRIMLIEKTRVAAHWSGEYGYTNGEMKLGTSPEKDVVFPLGTETDDPQVDLLVRQRLMEFSWASFLMQTCRYSDWVDRGRPAPCHRLWAIYLQWVSQQLDSDFLNAELVHADITADGKQWNLLLRNFNGETTELLSDRLMLTGPGKVRTDFLLDDPSTLPTGAYDLESFWRALKNEIFPKMGKLAIVGAGENAASALVALAKYAPELQAEVISPKGFVATRSENFYENRFYSQPEASGWTELTLADRKDFVDRTDLGVFSVHAMQILNDEVRHAVIPGRLKGLHRRDEKLILTVDYAGRVQVKQADYVILATGFDQVALLRSLLSARAFLAMGITDSSKPLALRIQKDLSIAGVEPALHLPMLAGLTQGPGFANLSCLGLLSDRVVLEPALAQIRKNKKAMERRNQMTLAEVSL